MQWATGLRAGVLLAAIGCAAGGCITPAPSTDDPLTPYSPQHAAHAPAAPTPGAPAPTYRYSPQDVDPALLADDQPTMADRLANLAPNKVWSRTREAVGLGPDEELARRLYTEADALFQQQQYADAAKKYKDAAGRWPDSALQEDAMFMQAECQFQLDQYSRANDTYTNLIKKYTNTRHMDMVMKRRFAIARYWDQRGRGRPMLAFNVTDGTLPFWDVMGNTIAVYESIRLDDPTGPLADDATMAAATTYFLKGRWEEAGYHFDLVRTEFPQSEFQLAAHQLGIQSKLRAYQGPHYDGKPLDDAKQLAHTLQSQFASQLPKDERERLRQTAIDIEAQIAERDWSLGEYYFNTKHYGAARYYYGELVKNYPSSRYADLARARIDEVKDMPPEPANEIEWLARTFGFDQPASGAAPAGSTAPPANAAPASPTTVVQQPPPQGPR